MPTVRKGSQTRQKGYQTNEQIERSHRDDRARDDISMAHAGDENDGPFSSSKKSHRGSTNLKSRKTEKSKDRVPKR
jgi:hypothetical protein